MAWANAAIFVGVALGLVLVWRRFLPDFRRDYGDRGPAYLLLFMVSFPLFVVVYLLDRRRDRRQPTSSADAPATPLQG